MFNDWAFFNKVFRFVCIRYIYYWNLQFLNNVIINKPKVHLSQVQVTLADFSHPDL